MSAIGLSGCLISTDQFMERWPLLSTLSSITKIFIRTVCCCCNQATLNRNRYISYVNSQDPLRIVTLLIPFLGNFLVWLMEIEQTPDEPSQLQPVAVERPHLLQQPVVRQLSVEEIYEEARECVKSGKPATAYARYLQAADKGFAFAAFHVAECYEKGYEKGGVVKKDLSLAKTYYERAAEKGHVESAAILALGELDSDHMEEMWKWLRRVQQNGSVKNLVEKVNALRNDDRGKEKLRMMIVLLIKKQASERVVAESCGMIDYRCPGSLVP